MRWLAGTVLVALLILGIGLPVAWLTRNAWAPPAVQWGVNAWAEREGHAGPAVSDLGFNIDSLSLDRLALSNLGVNGPEGFAADQVVVAYRWREILSGQIRSVALDAPRLTVTVDGDGAVSLGPLEPLRALATGGPAADEQAAATLPVVRFTDAVIAVQGAARGRIGASGSLGESDGLLGIAAEGSGALEGDDWRADGSGRVQASFADDRTRVNVTLTEARVQQGTLSAAGLRGTASVALSAGTGIEAIADLRADTAEADGVAVAVPSAHFRMDPLGLSAVFRLGDRDAPDLRLAVTADSAEADRRPIAVDLTGDLATLDRLAAAARRARPLGLTGQLGGTLRGSVPADLDDLPTAWSDTVAAGGLDLSGQAEGAEGHARFGVALAAGTLALETLRAARLELAADLLPEAVRTLTGEGPIAAVLGDGDGVFRLAVGDPFGSPTITVGGPASIASDAGARLAFDGEATLAWEDATAKLLGSTGTLSLSGLTVDDLTLRSATLVLDALAGDAGSIAGEGLLIAHLDAAELRGLRLSLPLRVVHDANGTAAFLERQGSITLPELPAAGSVAADGPVTLRLAAARRPALRVGFDDPGAVRLELPVVLPGLSVDLKGGVPLRIGLGSAQGLMKARFVAAPEGTRGGARGGVVVSLATPTVDVMPAAEDPAAPDGVALAGVALEMRASTGAAGFGLDRLVVSANRLSDRADQVRFSPVRLDGMARRTEGGPLAFTATVGGADGAFVLDAEGVHDIETGRGRAHLTVYPLVFVPGGLQPVALSPAASAMLRNASGSVSLAGAIEWPGRDVPPDDPLTLTLEDLAFTGSLGTVSGLSGSVAVSSIDPLTTLMGQTLTATGIDVGVPIAEPQVVFHIDPELNLVLESVQARFADGAVRTEGVTIPLTSSEPVSMILDVTGVDAARLAEVTELDGLTATGSLTGRLPLVWDFEEGLSVRRARLSAVNPGGTVKYRPETPPPALQDAGEEVSLLMEAVRNLVYEQFEIEADGRPGEPFDIRLRVRGANPDLFDGYPVALNVSLTGRLDEMFLNARRTLGLSDVLRRKLEARTAGTGNAGG